MTTGKKVLLVIGAVLLILTFSIITSLISNYNSFVTQEKIISAQYEQNKNNYDNYFKKVKEVAQVPEMYIADMEKVFRGVMEGRYGKEGSKAMWQWLQEQNPNIDASIYKQIQQVIEAGRNDFEANQKALIDKKRVYETMLGVFPQNIIAGIFGFPRIDLKSMGIVTSDDTVKAFETKKSAPLKLR